MVFLLSTTKLFIYQNVKFTTNFRPALLKVAKDIPILHTGISDTATEYSTYPVKEHNRLLSTSGKPMSTPLNSLLSMRNVKIPTDRNDPDYKDR